LRAKRALDRIALIDECSGGDGIAEALTRAGYEVSYATGDEPLAGDELVVRVSSPRRSGILGRTLSDTDETAAARSRAEARLAEMRQMESIARLAGGIAHDFNNILSVISICSDEVLEALGPDDPIRACLGDIRDAVARGSMVTRDLLAFSRRDMHDPRCVDLNDLVTSSHRMIEHVLGGDVTIDLALEARAANVRIDPSRWSSVFVHLALNARAAMPNGGSLRLRTRGGVVDPAEHGREQQKGPYVEIEVADTGCGMSEEVQARIFEPFFTTKAMGQGAGLGLSVVHGVVEESGGWIEVESQVGAGTTFRIFVPAEELEVERVPHAPRAVRASGGKATILVVEDEEAVRRFAVRALRRAGYDVLDAGSAEDALALLPDAAPVDLLFTDVVLPGMDGRRLAEELAKREPDVTVLYTSGYTNDEVLRRGVSRSELSFLQKPYATKDLLERVGELIATTKAGARTGP